MVATVEVKKDKKKDDWKIDEAKKWSDSKLWEIQRNYFHTKGIDAWKGEVPFYVSSNCFIANSYANLVLKLINQHIQNTANQAFQIIELGAGTGKFSYYFIKFLMDFLQNSTSSPIPCSICYTITDFSEKIIKSIENNVCFNNLKQKLSPNQQIEFTVWDFETAQKSIVKPGHVPIIIANYVFDCLQQDKFNLGDSALNEVQVALSNRYLKFDPQSPKTLGDLQFKENNIAINPQTYYKDNKLNTILQHYTQNMTPGTEFCLPVGAFNFINLLDNTQPYYLLVGDKGLSSIQDFEVTQKRELMSYDGCYSFLLNYDALNQYFDQLDGAYLGTNYVYTFGVHLYGNHLAKKDVQALKIDFNELFSRFGPKEYLSLCQEYQGSGYRFKLDSIIDFIKLSNYDPDAYGIVHDRLIELVPAINDYNKLNILQTLKKVEENIYVLGSVFDTYNLLGIFYQVLGDLEKAEHTFYDSIEIMGPTGPAYHNLGMLYLQKKDRAAAIVNFEKSLEVEQSNPLAKRKLNSLRRGAWQRIIIPLSKFGLIITAVLAAYLFIKYA